MKAIKTLLAVSVLAAAGAANAATTYTVFQNVDSSMYMGMFDLLDPALPHSGTGTATLADDGVLTIDATLHLETTFGTDTITHSLYTIPSIGGTNGTAQLLGCTNGPNDGANNTCSAAPVLFSDGVSTGSLGLAGGSVYLTFSGDTLTTYRFDLTPTPAVPVPAAAWLFGSGLIGLAGTARRRRAA